MFRRQYMMVGTLVFASFVSLAGSASAADEAPLEEALQATFRIAKGKSSGTCFIVAVDDKSSQPKRRTVVVTAAHVFEGFKDADATVHFRTKDAKGEYHRKEVSVAVRDGGKPLWTRHPEMDVAALFIDLPEGIDIKPLEFRQIAEEAFAVEKKVRVGQEVWIPCFPAQVEANAAGWPVLRRGTIASHPLIPLAGAKTIFIDYSHFGGDSGAPVLTRSGDTLMLVGLVIALQRQSDTTESPFEKRTVHTPLDLAITVQAPLVRETVELLLKK